MLRDFLRYPSVFKKSVQGKMFLFYRNLKLCPRENFIKMLPEGAILLMPVKLFSLFLGPFCSHSSSFLSPLAVLPASSFDLARSSQA